MKKPPNLPRLELTAAQLAAKAISFIREHLLLDCKAFIWTDSKITLGWILTTSRTLPIYVANRVRIIRETRGCFVGYVPTDLNPADAGTKGLDMRELQLNNGDQKCKKKALLWWHGPPYLISAQPPEKVYKIEEHPSTSPYEEFVPDICDEELITAITIESCNSDALCSQLIDLERFNNVNRVWHALAYVKRFVMRVSKKPFEGVMQSAPLAEPTKFRWKS